jgi:hypothetical protein
MNIDELNYSLQNSRENINSLKGLEIICEAIVYKVLDLFGKNALLSILFQIGAGPGEQISKRLKELYNKDDFEPLEAFELLFKELSNYYSIQVRDLQEDDEKIKLIIENHCFLREPIKNRANLKHGKAFCRVNKGYVETALKNLIGDKISGLEIKFLYNDDYKDACVEELLFYKKLNQTDSR